MVASAVFQGNNTLGAKADNVQCVEKVVLRRIGNPVDKSLISTSYWILVDASMQLPKRVNSQADGFIISGGTHSTSPLFLHSRQSRSIHIYPAESTACDRNDRNTLFDTLSKYSETLRLLVS